MPVKCDVSHHFSRKKAKYAKRGGGLDAENVKIMITVILSVSLLTRTSGDLGTLLHVKIVALSCVGGLQHSCIFKKHCCIQISSKGIAAIIWFPRSFPPTYNTRTFLGTFPALFAWFAPSCMYCIDTVVAHWLLLPIKSDSFDTQPSKSINIGLPDQ